MHTLKSITAIETQETWGLGEAWQVKGILHGSAGTQRLLFNPKTNWVRAQYIDIADKSTYWCDDSVDGETFNYRVD